MYGIKKIPTKVGNVFKTQQQLVQPPRLGEYKQNTKEKESTQCK